MNRKGFTFVELLAVIVILSIITTLSVVSYKTYTKKAKEKEVIALRETIESAYNNYRTKSLYNNSNVSEELSLNELITLGFIPEGLNYNKEQLSEDDLNNSKIKVVKKGSVIGNYLTRGACSDDLVKYGICKTEVDENSINIDSNDNIDADSMTFKCVMEDAGSLTDYCYYEGEKVIVFPSEDDAFCLYVELTDSKGNKKVLIDDISADTKPYCSGD